METINVQTALSLTGVSRRTLWRRVADGSLVRGASDSKGRMRLELKSVLERANLHVSTEDFGLILRADAGDADAQTDLSLFMLEIGRGAEAVAWFEVAGNQGNADAMQWLGQCYIAGTGVPKDQNKGLMWIAHAATLGHVVAEGQMKGLRPLEA